MMPRLAVLLLLVLSVPACTEGARACTAISGGGGYNAWVRYVRSYDACVATESCLVTRHETRMAQKYRANIKRCDAWQLQRARDAIEASRQTKGR